MFWQNFILLCSQNGQSPNGVCAELGLSTAIATRWKKGSIPRDTTLKKIADYFGITPEDLLRGPAEKVAAPAEPAPTSPLSDRFNNKLDRLTLQELRELEAFMDNLIKNRK